ncbi:HAD family hydrolase [Mycobacterium paraterrae]|uniref:phosphoserine phosphatase n=1 Tax=Mycobacterium paraterrae TaxID=577492 RepID=A0ABY3VG89_9MYCO|nr:HAD-IB family phosphatase [Mycobacterium paraterrae]UMB68323.1 HAD-IB family phosphatase [Mycobacterium paraterrae]
MHPRHPIPLVEAGPLLHVFDMDGTLLMGAAIVELSRYVGRLAEATDIEEAYLRGEIDDISFWNRALALWHGVTEEQIDRAFDAAMWMHGVRDVFDDIHERGERSIVISQSPHFFVKRLEGWGAHAAFGSNIWIGETVTATSTLLAEDKVSITREILALLGLGPQNCVAYGDSTSDVALFSWLPNTIAVNAKDPLNQLAAKSYVGVDFREAYRLGRSLVDVHGAERHARHP